MRLLGVFAAAGLALLASLAHAETVSGLYQVREPLQGQGADARAQATTLAFDTLVLRLTGDAKAAQGAGLAALRNDPQAIINQIGTEAGPPERLSVEFDPGSTERALRKAGLALWGSNRPSMLAWWLIDGVDGSTLVADGQDSAAPVRQAARHRGLPVRLPLGDLQEQLMATAPALESGAVAPLREAAERYGADALLAVHVQPVDDHWKATWRLWLGKQEEQGSVTAADPGATADAVMLAVATRLAPRYAVRPGSSGEQRLQVQNATFARYAELNRALEPYGPRLLSVEGRTLTYAVTGNPEQLRAQLGLVKLQEVSGTPETARPADAAPSTVEPAPFDGLRYAW